MDNYSVVIGNDSDGESEGFDVGPSLYTRIAFAITWIIIAIAGFLGNSLVIFVAIRFQKMHNVTNCFIVNLAITDIVFLVFCMPLLVVQYTSDYWPLNEIFCKLLNFISFVSVLVTVLTLVGMTIDRYIYVVRPFENLKWRKPMTVFLLSIVIWIISCLFAYPFYHNYGVMHSHDDKRQCALLSEEHLQTYFRIYTVTLYYFIPLAIIIISYTKLLYYVYSKENKLKPNTKYSVVKWSKKRRAVTKMVGIVTLVFSLCWLPITLYIMFPDIFTRKMAFYYYKMIAHSLAYLNSAINPILYAFLNRSFRTNCGSIFSEPSCTLFCGDDYGSPQRQHQAPCCKRPPSTQIDRFSYQSTNRQSTLSSQSKTNKKTSIVTNGSYLTANIGSPTDFSDGDCEPFEAECSSQMQLSKSPGPKYRSTDEYERLPAHNTNSPLTQTTSF